jgi:hypothetical protein
VGVLVGRDQPKALERGESRPDRSRRHTFAVCGELSDGGLAAPAVTEETQEQLHVARTIVKCDSAVRQIGFHDDSS